MLTRARLSSHFLQRLLEVVTGEQLEHFGITRLGLLDDLGRHLHVLLAFLCFVLEEFGRSGNRCAIRTKPFSVNQFLSTCLSTIDC
jgi:hypothetical protein